MGVYDKFDKHAPQMICDLVNDFPFKPWQAAAFPGNSAAESSYFNDIVEDGALAKGWAGGTGWFQWTGKTKNNPRRAQFEAWLKRKGWKADSYLGNYSFLYRELKGYVGTEKRIVELVKNSKSLEEACELVCRVYLRPAKNNYAPRIAGARRALALYEEQKQNLRPTKWPTDAKIEEPVVEPTLPTPEPPAGFWEWLVSFLTGQELTKETTMIPGINLPNILIGAVRGAVAEVVPNMVLPEMQKRIDTAHHTAASNELPKKAQASIDVAGLSDAVIARLQQDPRFQAVEKQTSPIPVWKSGVTIGSTIAFLAPLLGGILGLNLTEADQQQIAGAATGAITVIGALISLVSRFKSRAQPVTFTNPK